MLTLNQLAEGMPGSTGENRALFLQPLNDAMVWRCIDTPLRQSAFLATIAEESGQLKYTSELWDPTPAQVRYERDFTQPWPVDLLDYQSHPERFNRNGKAFELGNANVGDGKKFKGHGLIQVTGMTNHFNTGLALGLDLVNHPEMLKIPVNAANSAAHFWSTHGCNKHADIGDFRRCTIIVNGGTTNWEKRLAFYLGWKRILRC